MSHSAIRLSRVGAAARHLFDQHFGARQPACLISVNVGVMRLPPCSGLMFNLPLCAVVHTNDTPLASCITRKGQERVGFHLLLQTVALGKKRLVYSSKNEVGYLFRRSASKRRPSCSWSSAIPWSSHFPSNMCSTTRIADGTSSALALLLHQAQSYSISEHKKAKNSRVSWRLRSLECGGCG